MRRPVVVRVAVALAALGAGNAVAELRLDARSAASHREADGRVVFAVILVNDSQARTGTLSIEQRREAGARACSMQLELAAGARRRFLMSLDSLPGGDDFRVVFRQGREDVAERLLEVPSLGWPLHVVGVLGPVPGWLRRASSAGAELAAFELLADDLPDDPRAWPRADAILWPAPRTGDLDAARSRALEEWVARGGRLLLGTSADQPRALEELGFEQTPSDGAWRRLGLGEVARAAEDLSLHAPPAHLLPAAPDRAALLDRQGHWVSSPPFVTTCESILAGGWTPPKPPLHAVAFVLTAYLLLVGPGEWWLQRHRAKQGRRVRGAAWRRVLAVALAAGSVFVLCGGLEPRPMEALRIDVVDLSLDGRAARGSSLVFTRGRRGGWASLAAPSGTRLGPAPGSDDPTHGTSEPDRLALASPSDSALPSESLAFRAPWATVAWSADFVPEAAAVEAFLGGRLRTLLEALEAGEPVEAARLVAAAPPTEELEAQFAGCHPAGLDELARLADCGAFSLASDAALARRARRAPDGIPSWPGGPALVFAETGALGPPLRLDGVPLRGEAATIWRVRLPDQGERP